MGHQASFYLTRSDTVALEARLRERFEFVVFRYRSKSSTPHLVDSLYDEEDGEQVFGLFVARPEDLNSVVLDYVETQKYWTVETDPSPVIEVRGSSLRDNTFRAGRVYYVDGFYSPDDNWVTRRMKSEEFCKWAKSFLSAVKKSLKRVEPFPKCIEYAGEEAAALLKSGAVKVAP